MTPTPIPIHSPSATSTPNLTAIRPGPRGRVVTARFVPAAASRRGRAPVEPQPAGRIPRVARLLALAHRLQGLLDDGCVRNQAELAAISHVTRARLTQLLNLLLLAPDVQEEILHLPPVRRGRDPICEADLRPIVAFPTWDEQRAAWRSAVIVSLTGSPQNEHES